MTRVQTLSSDILNQFSDGILTDESILENLDEQARSCPSGNPTGCKCDNLLREFHRFDEDLSVQGKWAGGSVTSVCRGWGTSKVRRLVTLFVLIIGAVESLTSFFLFVLL